MRDLARTVTGTMRAREPLRRALAQLKRQRNRTQAREQNRTQGSQRLRVLVVMNGGIGNAVQATPLVQAIQMHWPQAQIDLFTPYQNLFAGWSLVHEYVEGLQPRPNHLWDHTFITWSSILPEGDAERGDLGHVHTVPLLGAWFVKPEREYNLDMIRKLGFRGSSPPLYVSLSAPGSWVSDDAVWVALVPGGHAGAKWQNKRWPHFNELLQLLLESSDEIRVCILGGPDDPPVTAPNHQDRVLDLRGKCSLSEVAWILKRMDAVIGNDSGPMHIADAVHAPAIVLFGPTCEVKNGPLHGGRALTSSIECRPCQYVKTQFTCSDPRCLSEIRPDQVLKTVSEFLPVDASARGFKAEPLPSRT